MTHTHTKRELEAISTLSQMEKAYNFLPAVKSKVSRSLLMHLVQLYYIYLTTGSGISGLKFSKFFGTNQAGTYRFLADGVDKGYILSKDNEYRITQTGRDVIRLYLKAVFKVRIT